MNPYLQQALKLAKGEYQRGLLLGYYNLSGAGLKGRAKEYGYHYRRSRQELFARMRSANIPFHVVRSKHGKLTLHIDNPPPDLMARARLGEKNTPLVRHYLGIDFW